MDPLQASSSEASTERERSTAPVPSSSVSPRELFCALFTEPEESVEYWAAAARFAEHACSQAVISGFSHGASEDLAERLMDWAQADLERPLLAGYASSWPARIVREFGPVGLLDGVWLEGTRATDDPAVVEQLRLRFGRLDGTEAYARRYAVLMHSLGMPAQAVGRWDFDESPPCADISYEHGLLGLSLALSPARFSLEIVGYNLWMASMGPCPLLSVLLPELSLRDACLRYLEQHAGERLCELAKRATRTAAHGLGPQATARIVRGFSAAHRSYARWQRAMLGANIPFAPREFVLESVRRKARFAIEHHREVHLKGHNLAQLFQDGEAAHEKLLDHLAQTASLIRPGAPDRSPFMTHALSLDGPMFDAFTAPEKHDLREWIASLAGPQAPKPARERVALTGTYGARQSLAELQERATQAAFCPDRASAARLLGELDRRPESSVLARRIAERLCAVLEALFSTSQTEAAPPFSEANLLSMVEQQRALDPNGADSLDVEGGAPPLARAWLRSFSDVRRAHFEDYGLLFDRCVSAHEDAFHAHHAAQEPEPWQLLPLALALHSRQFEPEILGVQLGSESCATAARDEHILALSTAILAFMERVKEGAPDAVEAQWQRVWRLWRCALVWSHGSQAERASLRAVLHGVDLGLR